MKNWNGAFDPVRPDGALREKIMKMDRQREEKAGVSWKRIAAVAATLAVLLTAAFWPGKTADGQLVTAPGVMKVYAYDLSEGTDISELEYTELEVGVEMPYEYGWSLTTNVVPGLPIKLSMPEDFFEGAEISFEVTVTGGEFFEEVRGEYYFGPSSYLGQHFLQGNNQTVYWHCFYTDVENWGEEYDYKKVQEQLAASAVGETTGYELPEVTYFLEKETYMDVIIRADGHIVGCMTVMIYSDPLPPLGDNQYSAEDRYYAKLLGSAYCPKQDGEYQRVSSQQMDELMRSWK